MRPAARPRYHFQNGTSPASSRASAATRAATGLHAKARKPLVIDLAHRGETVSQALAKLDKAVSECVWHGHPSLKVTHGHGSGGGASRTKPQVLAMLRKHADRLGALVEQDGDNPEADVLRWAEIGGI